MASKEEIEELMSKLSLLLLVEEGKHEDSSPNTCSNSNSNTGNANPEDRNNTAYLPSLIPFLFHPDHHEAAQHLLMNFISTKNSESSVLRKVAFSILNHINHSLTNTENPFLISDAILRLVLSQFQSKDASIATQSNQALLALHGIRPTIAATILKHLQTLFMEMEMETDNLDSTIIVRYYTLMAHIFSENPAAATDNSNSMKALFQPFMVYLQNDSDPLMQMSLLEILDSESSSSSSSNSSDEWIRHMNWEGLNLDNVLLSMVENHHPFCAGAALRILVKRDLTIPPEQCLKVLITFGRNMSGEVEKIGFIQGLTSFCTCACNIDGDGNDTVDKHKRLQMVLNEEEILNEWLSFRKGNSKMKVVVMNSIAQVLRGLESNNMTNSDSLSSKLRLDLFRSIGPVNDIGRGCDAVEIIMEYVKSQIVELRFGAYDLLTAVAGVKTGAHLLMRFGGFFEFLCNRNLEIVKEGKELKFDLVKAIYESDVTGLLSDDVSQVLRQVVEEGPFYINNTNTFDVLMLNA